MSTPRFHVPEAAPGARVSLPEHSARHARDVLRLRAGVAVRVFDGHGHEFAAVLEAVSRRSVAARLGAAVESRPESPLHVVLALSPLKGDRMELVIQKATELGVAEIWPVLTARSDAVARPALAGARHERWQRVASGASEQCGRAVVPALERTRTLAELLDTATGWDGQRIVLLEKGNHPPLASLLPPPALRLLLLVGPAGGWEAGEAERLRQYSFQPVSLGPRILRSETAAVVAVAAAQLTWGDLGNLAPTRSG